MEDLAGAVEDGQPKVRGLERGIVVLRHQQEVLRLQVPAQAQARCAHHPSTFPVIFLCYFGRKSGQASHLPSRKQPQVWKEEAQAA
jgi:hypothetical protein